MKKSIEIELIVTRGEKAIVIFEGKEQNDFIECFPVEIKASYYVSSTAKGRYGNTIKLGDGRSLNIELDELPHQNLNLNPMTIEQGLDLTKKIGKNLKFVIKKIRKFIDEKDDFTITEIVKI